MSPSPNIKSSARNLRRFMMRSGIRFRSYLNVGCVASGIILFATCGCSTTTTSRSEILEAAMRNKETEIARLEEQLSDTRAQLQSSRRETDVLHRQMSNSAASGPLPEQVHMLSEVAKISINTLLSGGLDTNNSSHDDTLHLVLEPLDAQDDLIKVPGEFHVQLRDKNGQSLKTWKFSTADSLNHWRSTGLIHGFVFDIPLPPALRTNAPEVAVRMTTADGRVFKSSATLRVSRR